jgi:hypothetical protein
MDRTPIPARPDIAPRSGSRSTTLILGIVVAGLFVSFLGYRVAMTLTDSIGRVAADVCDTEAGLRAASNELASGGSEDFQSRFDTMLDRFDGASDEFASEAERAVHEGDPALGANLRSLSVAIADLVDSTRSQDFASVSDSLNRIEILAVGVQRAPAIEKQCSGVTTV